MNKLQSFLAEYRALAQAVEPRDQATIDGGTITIPDPTWGPSGGCIPPHVPKKPIIVDGPSQPQPLPHGQW
jgi:hypothetical protein